MTPPDPITPLPGDRPVRLALVGLGSAAQVLHLPVLSEMDEVELVGLCDVESYKVAMLSERTGVPGFLELEQMFEKTHPGAVLICTPTISHLPLALAAMHYDAHVIVEKPVARDLAETTRLADAAREHGKLALVAMNQRFRQDVAILKNYMEAGKLGDVWRFRSGWLKRIERWNHSPWLDERNISGGGVLMDLGVQLIDIILWLMDYPAVRRAVAFTNNITLGREVEDTVAAVIEFANDSLLQLDCSWGLRADRDVVYTYVDGSQAAARLPGLTLTQVGREGLEISALVKDADPRSIYGASFRTQLQQFVNMLRGELEPASTAAEAVRVMEVVDLVYRSAAERREIRFDSD